MSRARANDLELAPTHHALRIITQREFAYQRDDGLLVLPYACIEP